MSNLRRSALSVLVIGLMVASTGCAALRDAEPFTATISYEEAPGGGITLTPDTIQGDAAFGEVQVVNDAGDKHGFAIDKLAVFEEIPSGRSKTISISEAEDDTTYTFYCQLHPGEFTGKLVIDYVEEAGR